MIDVTKLFFEEEQGSDTLRYGVASAGQGRGVAETPAKSAAERRPVVVWNTTRTCNLRCVHCYADSYPEIYPGELTREQASALLADLAAYKVPAVLLSGGEPLVRPDLLDILHEAASLGLKVTISTNGTRINREKAKFFKKVGVAYVGISFDGLGVVNDRFRGVPGAFEAALQGLRHCVEAGQKVGLRFTLTRRNVENMDGLFDFIEQERIPRVCFYHLVYAGRGSALRGEDLSHEETRQALDKILERTGDLVRRGKKVQVLTVDNHVDGAYLYLKLRTLDPARAERLRGLLEWNGGGRYSSGVGIANVDTQGNVHPDQFWHEITLGNVKERKFSDIWQDRSHPVHGGLLNRLERLTGRCHDCSFLQMCGGSFRARAAKVYNDPWAPDPSCYLTDREIGLAGAALS